jgi:hypothetical protein
MSWPISSNAWERSKWRKFTKYRKSHNVMQETLNKTKQSVCLATRWIIPRAQRTSFLRIARAHARTHAHTQPVYISSVRDERGQCSQQPPAWSMWLLCKPASEGQSVYRSHYLERFNLLNLNAVQAGRSRVWDPIMWMNVFNLSKTSGRTRPWSSLSL